MEVLMDQRVLYFVVIVIAVAWAIALFALPFIVWSMKDSTQEILREIKHLNALVASFKKTR